MNTIFINSENSKTSKAHILMLKLTNELDLRSGEKIIALSNLSIYYTWENIKILEITEVVLVHCNMLITIIRKIQEFYIHLF